MIFETIQVIKARFSKGDRAEASPMKDGHRL